MVNADDPGKHQNSVCLQPLLMAGTEAARTGPGRSQQPLAPTTLSVPPECRESAATVPEANVLQS